MVTCEYSVCISLTNEATKYTENSQVTQSNLPQNIVSNPSESSHLFNATSLGQLMKLALPVLSTWGPISRCSWMVHARLKWQLKAQLLLGWKDPLSDILSFKQIHFKYQISQIFIKFIPSSIKKKKTKLFLQL